MANKITKRDHYNALLAIKDVASRPELVEFIQHELELLEKKNSSRKSELSETQKENLALADEILAYIGDKTVTVADVRKHFGLSSQKVSPIMGRLADDGKLVKSVDKRVSYYAKA